MALPPDNTGAHKLRTMPPTWNRGIMFTTGELSHDRRNAPEMYSLLTSCALRSHDLITAHVPTMRERREYGTTYE